MLIRAIPKYSLELSGGRPLSCESFRKTDLLITLPPLNIFREETIVSAEGSLEIKIIRRSLDVSSSDPEMSELRRENCFDIRENDVSILAIAFVTETLEGVTETLHMYLPLTLEGVCDKPLSLWFNGTWLRILSEDGEILNEHSGVGDLVTPKSVRADEGVKIYAVDSSSVEYEKREEDINMGMYFPYGFNTHVGDVMTFAHDGVYHIAYLIDRRHHHSRGCRGSHYIAHLTTRDFKLWEEHPPIAEIEHPYETFGTGTMFYHKGKYYMSYGLHTDRHPSGQFSEPSIDPETGVFMHKTFSDAFNEGKMPMGATLSVSEDGINFKKTELLYHGAQNPSVYSKADGGLILYGGYGGEGIYVTDDITKPFIKEESKLVFCGPNTALNCSSECPAFFEMNGYRYLIVGFRGYFRTVTPDSVTMADAIKLGETIYDGLCVPMVAELDNGRRIIAGWIRHELGWGGAMLQRELIQEEGGKLGMKWIPELYPEKVGSEFPLDNAVTTEKKTNHILEGIATADENGVFALNIGSGDSFAQLKLDLNEKKAQLTDAPDGNAMAETIPTPYEKRLSEGDYNFNALKYSNNYAIPGVDVERAFTLRILLRYAPKMRTTVCDIEIDGKRTMILMKPNLFVDTLTAVAGEIKGTVSKIKA